MERLGQMVLSGETQFLMSAATLLALIIITFKISAYIKSLENTVDDNKKRLDKVEDSNESMYKEHNLIKLTQAVLETRLENIELGITEIKAMFAKHIEK